MKKPDLTLIWEMAIRIPDMRYANEHLPIFWEKVIPTINCIEKDLGIKWYTFLIHNNNNGVPLEYEGLQYHIRFENIKNIDEDKIKQVLPDYCEGLRRAKIPKSISSIDLNLIENEDIGELWKLLGEFCQWYVNLIKIHKKDIKTKSNLNAFFHYHANILQPNIILNLAQPFIFI